jgi:hypothetical protein
MATNNNAHTLDSAGQPAVDFVWGNLALQPNDVRGETAASNIGGTTGSNALGYKTAVVTATSSDGTTVTYTSANTFKPGELVTITGLTTAAGNLTNAIIATASATNFTVTSAVSTSDSAQTATAKVIETAIRGIGADAYWAATSAVTGARLDFAGTSAYSGSNAIPNVTVMSGRHEIIETGYAGYPNYTPDVANYMVTAASGNGTTVSYTSFNNLQPGDSVNITGLTTSAFNLSAATVATANRQGFTVTNSATGTAVTGAAYGKVQATNAVTAYDGTYVSGVAYINVPSILGLATALGLDALKDAGYATANITNTIGATNTATQPTQINVTTTTAATVTVSGGTSTWGVGTKVTISAGTGIPTALVGSWTVTGGSGSTLIIAGSGWTVADTGAITPGTQLKGTPLTVKSQSTAAGAASVALSATITMTSWA